MKRFAFALALGLLFGAQSALQAAPLWSYSWSVTPIAIPATTGGGSVSLTNSISGIGAGNSNIVATNLVTNSSAPNGTPDLFSAASQPYSLELTLTDTDSGLSDTFTFTGHFEGSVSQNSANILNFFDVPTSITKDIGDNSYTVEIGPYTPPGAPGGVGGQGAIGAFVTVEEGDGDPQDPNDVPEPTSMLLGGLGMAMMGLVYRRRQQA